MCQYSNVRTPDRTYTVEQWTPAVPPTIAKTGVPGEAEMSMPKWKVRDVRSPVMRGSSRYPRTGCGRSNGFSGQPYDHRASGAFAGSEITCAGSSNGPGSPPFGLQGHAAAGVALAVAPWPLGAICPAIPQRAMSIREAARTMIRSGFIVSPPLV